MVFQLIQKIKERTQVSNAFVLLLYLLNAAIVMNFHKFIFSNFLISIFFIFNSVFALLNQKFYRILILNGRISILYKTLAEKTLKTNCLHLKISE